MVNHDIKRGHFKKIEGDKLRTLMQETFGNVTQDGPRLSSRFGALDPISIQVVDKNTIDLTIVTKQGVDDATAQSSIKARNVFLEAATGFNAKQRSKRLQQKVKDGDL